MMGQSLKNIGKEMVDETSESSTPVTTVSDITINDTARRKGFNLIPESREKKLTVPIPESLFKSIAIQARLEDKTIKQFVGEILIDFMRDHYNYKEGL
jgi:hypothetical protein